MPFKKFLRLYKNIISMSVWSLCAVGGILFGVFPLAQKSVTVWRNVQALTKEVNVLKNKSDMLALLDEDTLRRHVLTLASAVPPDKSLPSILTAVDTVSGGSGLAIGDVSLIKPGSLATESAKKLSQDEAKIGASLLPFSVSGRGSFDQIRSFLSAITTVRRMFRVRSMNISFRDTLPSVRADLDAYYYPYPSAVGTTQSIVNLTPEEEQTIALVGKIPLASATSVSAMSASMPSGKDDPFSP